MPKARQVLPAPLSLKLPDKRTKEKFLIIYEIHGCQRAFDFLVEYYSLKRMHIVFDGRKVGNNFVACYLKNYAYFKKEGLKKRITLHEFYHHLISRKKVALPNNKEEKEATHYSQMFSQDN